MPYVPGFEWDVFISYAHDDKQGDSEDAQWINWFKANLAARLNLISGEQFTIYYDAHAQRFNEPIKDILAKVAKSSIFVIIGSPNYVASTWCRKEVQHFRETFDDISERTFITEIMRLPASRSYPTDVPANLRALFWYQKDGGPRQVYKRSHGKYKQLIGRMADQILEQLDAMKADVKAPAATASEPAGRAMIAYGREMEEDSENLAKYLTGLKVDLVTLPDPMPTDEAGFTRVISDALARSDVYIQLLGRKRMRMPPGWQENPTNIQYRLAGSAKAKDDIFLWRPDDFDPERNEDVPYRPLLRPALNISIPELAKTVRDRLNSRAVASPAASGEGLKIVINAGIDDDDFAYDLLGVCEKRACTAVLDNFGDNEDLRNAWADADAVAFVQGRMPPEWLVSRYWNFDRTRAAQKVQKPPSGRIILYAPPPPKRAGIKAPDLVHIDVTDGWTTAEFEQWLDRLGVARLPAA